MKMSKIVVVTIAVVFVFLLAGCANSTSKITEYDGYELLWNDEFKGNTLDDTIWSREVHAPGWTNNELQEYTTSEDNAFVQDGILTIKAIETETENGKYYTSARLATQFKKDFTYGKVVVRAKVPEGRGLWPAIWMMPSESSIYGDWPRGGEIDIMEILGNDTTLAYSTIHYGVPHAEKQGRYSLLSGKFSDDFHEFSVEWEPNELRFYVDGNLTNVVNDWFSSYENMEAEPYPAPFDQDFYVILNLAVGGDWPGSPDGLTDFDNAEFYVDYVRVYQKESYDTENITKPEVVIREADENGNYVNNGDFSEEENLEDIVSWKFLLADGGMGSASLHDDMIEIQTLLAGTVDYSVQLVQPDIPMQKGCSYKLSFDVKADEQRPLIVCVSAPNKDWIRYFPDTIFSAPTEWKTYTYEFTMEEEDDPAARLEFNLGNKNSTATVYITNVKLEKIGS